MDVNKYVYLGGVVAVGKWETRRRFPSEVENSVVEFSTSRLFHSFLPAAFLLSTQRFNPHLKSSIEPI